MTAHRVLVVRAAHQSDRLSVRLAEAGFVPVVVPVIAMQPPDDEGVALSAALERGESFEWIVFTSSNAVAAIPAIPRGPRLAVVGPGTAQALTDRGRIIDLMPDISTAEGLVEAFAQHPPARVLLPLAAGARPTLADGLSGLGWQVTAVPAYRTVARVPDAAELEAARSCDAVLFTSSSSVLSWRAVASVADTPLTVVSIGPQTSTTVRFVGLKVTAEANPHTLDGLVQATRSALMP